MAKKAITAGILYDLGSGGNVDICILTKEKVEHIRPYEVVGKKVIEKKNPYKFKKNNIEVLKEEVIKFGEEGMEIEN